ncbi:winged helix-turn-helix transcriptional regulator [Flavihumibacter petaseus]|uniref:Putative HxlR family transcriptional regulator n=1 Tax=Flavihumibacter petaseus NBRC 106054 TaxID=1220578 RepID=A0A0E9N192_9BACT|nr:helix-turn-helix domain-containing protein [Flavihumibacter petaseus]GAO43120.1 putative HxlR family transcriptional regulator [Flavihumibacter petaseus NBRC 106054]
MTTPNNTDAGETCPAQQALKLLSGKWKPQILRLAEKAPLRFNSLLRQLEGTNKQALSVALREMESAELLQKTVIQQKPLHIEYHLTEKGMAMIPVLRQLEKLT